MKLSKTRALACIVYGGAIGFLVATRELPTTLKLKADTIAPKPVPPVIRPPGTPCPTGSPNGCCYPNIPKALSTQAPADPETATKPEPEKGPEPARAPADSAANRAAPGRRTRLRIAASFAPDGPRP